MIELKDLSKSYASRDKHGKRVEVTALRHVSLTLNDHTRYALLGESGSGKSTLARLLTGVEKPTGGEIWFDGKNIAAISPKALRMKRREIQLVLQNAQSSLDPRLRIYDSIAEPIRCLTRVNPLEEHQRVLGIAQRVKLPEPLLDRFPYELSGGQQKRACIARAMSVSPKFIVFDESVSGLDVTLRKQILDLILQLNKDGGLTMYLFITHDPDVASYMADNILIMKDGSIIEQKNCSH